MNQKRIRFNLQRLTRSELEDLSERTLGSKNSSENTKSDLIDLLMIKHRRVSKEIGMQTSWLSRHAGLTGLVIGIAGLVATVATLYVQNSNVPNSGIDPLRRQKIIDQVTIIRESLPTPLSRPGTDRIKSSPDGITEATVDGFELLDHSVILDMRSFVDFDTLPSVDRWEIEMGSPVVQHIRQTLRKIDKDNSSSYRLRAHTSGTDVYCESTTHEGRFKVHESSNTVKSAQYKVKPRIIDFDVSDDPNEFFVEVAKTFWNAFQNDDQSWAGVVVGLPTQSISYLIVFPDDKPYTSYEFLITDINGNRIDQIDDVYVLSDSNNEWIWWGIPNPVPGHHYNIDWEW